MMIEQEDALLTVSRWQREPNAVVQALTTQLFHDMKLSMEAVTGKCEWREDVTSTELEELSYLADEMAHDLWSARFAPGAIPSEARKQTHRMDCLRAASEAFSMHSENREREERIARSRRRPSASVMSQTVARTVSLFKRLRARSRL